MSVVGLLLSQIGYDEGRPMRALVRGPQGFLPEGARWRVGERSGTWALWGETWGSWWWVADFSGLPSGEHRLETDGFCAEPFLVGKNPDYDPVDPEKNVFPTEIKEAQRDDSRSVYIELAPNECSLHDARVMHSSEPNTSAIRRCGWTLRFTSSAVKFNQEAFDGMHLVYLARSEDRGSNTYADPTKAYPEVLERRGQSKRYRHSH